MGVWEYLVLVGGMLGGFHELLVLLDQHLAHFDRRVEIL